MSTDDATTVERRSDRELVVTRTLKRPARLVFEIWTRPKLFKQWGAEVVRLMLISYKADVRIVIRQIKSAWAAISPGTALPAFRKPHQRRAFLQAVEEKIRHLLAPLL